MIENSNVDLKIITQRFFRKHQEKSLDEFGVIVCKYFNPYTFNSYTFLCILFRFNKFVVIRCQTFFKLHSYYYFNYRRQFSESVQNFQGLMSILMYIQDTFGILRRSSLCQKFTLYRIVTKSSILDFAVVIDTPLQPALWRNCSNIWL